MKKLQFVFAVLAVFVASAGVFASKMLTPVYFESTSAVADCSVPLRAGISVCSGSLNQCDFVSTPGSTTYYISQDPNGDGDISDCIVAPKN